MTLIVIVSVVVFSVFSFNKDEYVVDLEMIKKINSDPDIPWKAGVNAFFVGKKYKDIEPLLFNQNEGGKDSKMNQQFVPTIESLPDHYNVFESHPVCKKAIRSQEHCGSDWAFSGAEVLADRFCVATKGKDTDILSPQDWLSCDTTDFGCTGGLQSRLWEYALQNGIVTEKCFPYTSGSGSVEKCPNKCKDGEDWGKVKHKISNYTHYSSIDEVMEGIMNYGSIQAWFENYQDFLSYKSGVYVHKWGTMGGSHVAKCIGWGVDSESGLPYWNCALSWGTGWGMEGYFWILRGSDECQIEDNMFGPIPLVNS